MGKKIKKVLANLLGVYLIFSVLFCGAGAFWYMVTGSAMFGISSVWYWLLLPGALLGLALS